MQYNKVVQNWLCQVLIIIGFGSFPTILIQLKLGVINDLDVDCEGGHINTVPIPSQYISAERTKFLHLTRAGFGVSLTLLFMLIVR